MRIQDAIHLVRETCALRHLSLNTEKTYVHWLGRYGLFLDDPKIKDLTTERKMETFLTRLARACEQSGPAATQRDSFSPFMPDTGGVHLYDTAFPC